MKNGIRNSGQRCSRKNNEHLSAIKINNLGIKEPPGEIYNFINF